MKRTEADGGWAAMLQDEMVAKLVTRPEGEGWKTARELAEAHGITYRAMHNRVLEWLAEGKIERALGRSPHNNKTTHYYRPKDRNGKKHR